MFLPTIIPPDAKDTVKGKVGTEFYLLAVGPIPTIYAADG